MKVIITVSGSDKPGIIASVSGMLAENNINIEEISQTIMQGQFTMIMVASFNELSITLGTIKAKANVLGDEIGVKIFIQNEDIFNAMHRI